MPSFQVPDITALLVFGMIKILQDRLAQWLEVSQPLFDLAGLVVNKRLIYDDLRIFRIRR